MVYCLLSYAKLSYLKGLTSMTPAQTTAQLQKNQIPNFLDASGISPQIIPKESFKKLREEILKKEQEQILESVYVLINALNNQMLSEPTLDVWEICFYQADDPFRAKPLHQQSYWSTSYLDGSEFYSHPVISVFLKEIGQTEYLSASLKFIQPTDPTYEDYESDQDYLSIKVAYSTE